MVEGTVDASRLRQTHTSGRCAHTQKHCRACCSLPRLHTRMCSAQTPRADRGHLPGHVLNPADTLQFCQHPLPSSHQKLQLRGPWLPPERKHWPQHSPLVTVI